MGTDCGISTVNFRSWRTMLGLCNQAGVVPWKLGYKKATLINLFLVAPDECLMQILSYYQGRFEEVNLLKNV